MEGVFLFAAIMIIGLVCYILVVLKLVKDKREYNKKLENCCKSLESLNHTLKEANKELDEMYEKFKRSNKKQNEALNSYFH